MITIKTDFTVRDGDYIIKDEKAYVLKQQATNALIKGGFQL